MVATTMYVWFSAFDPSLTVRWIVRVPWLVVAAIAGAIVTLGALSSETIHQVFFFLILGVGNIVVPLLLLSLTRRGRTGLAKSALQSLNAMVVNELGRLRHLQLTLGASSDGAAAN
jgi:hypothetical protein